VSSFLEIPVSCLDRIYDHLIANLGLNDFEHLNCSEFLNRIDNYYEFGDSCVLETTRNGLFRMIDNDTWDSYDLRRESFIRPMIENHVPFNFWHNSPDEQEIMTWYRPEFQIPNERWIFTNDRRSVYTMENITSILDVYDKPDEAFLQLVLKMQEDDFASVKWSIENYV
jgi:hypothetical protein